MPTVRIKRGTKAALDTLAGASGLAEGEQYLLTDPPLSGLAVGLTPSTYALIGSRRWTDSDFHLNGTAGQVFAGSAISTGTTNVNPAAYDAAHPGTVLLRTSTTANSGYRWMSQTNLRGGKGLRFVGIVRMPPAINASTTIRMGLLDSTTSADAVDGAYIEVVNTTLSCKTANNSTRTTAGTALTVAANDWRTVSIEYLTDTSVQFVVYDDSGTVLLDQTISTNVPNTDARVFVAGAIATNSGTTALDLVLIDYMGVGR
jgi:hypothetical protein